MPLGVLLGCSHSSGNRGVSKRRGTDEHGSLSVAAVACGGDHGSVSGRVILARPPGPWSGGGREAAGALNCDSFGGRPGQGVNLPSVLACGAVRTEQLPVGGVNSGCLFLRVPGAGSLRSGALERTRFPACCALMGREETPCVGSLLPDTSPHPPHHSHRLTRTWRLGLQHRTGGGGRNSSVAPRKEELRMDA